MLEFDFSALAEAVKSFFSISVVFYKAAWNLLTKLWDLLSEIVGVVSRILNK